MSKLSKVSLFSEIFIIILVSTIGCMGIVFSVLYVDTFSSGFVFEYYSLTISTCIGVISVLCVTTIIFLRKSREIIYKLLIFCTALVVVCLIVLYLLKINGFLSKVKDVERLREYIESFGGYAVGIFILIQILQVVVLPIPSFITVGAGVLLFGALKGACFSTIGIICGSLLSFLFGRYFGTKIANWLMGKNNIKKCLKLIEGKDKFLLSFMYLFPFFPDDMLCFVAGITKISVRYFFVMIIITRTIAVFTASFSMSNSLIPYDTWWGILLWGLLFCGVLAFSVLVIKKSNSKTCK